MMLETFSTYFFINIRNLSSTTVLWEISDFFLWDLHIILPTIYALIVCSKTCTKAKILADHLEKYSNFSHQDSMTLKVNDFIKDVLGILNFWPHFLPPAWNYVWRKNVVWTGPELKIKELIRKILLFFKKKSSIFILWPSIILLY